MQVVVLADRGPRYSTADGDWTGTLAFNVWKGMKATPENAVADWGERDMGSPQTLIDFVTWARASYPSRRTALFFWDHGWGWWPGYTMHDVTSNDSLDMDEIRRAMETVDGVDMVGMDTCLGQTIEVQATFRGFADALAASEDSIGYTGVDYARVLTRLEADPAMGAAALAKTAAASYRSGHDRWTLASSAVALDWRWDRLVRQVDLLAWKLRAGMKKHRREYAAAYRRVAAALYGDPTSVDLYDAAAQLRRTCRFADAAAHLPRRDARRRQSRPLRVEHAGRGPSARHRHLLARRSGAAASGVGLHLVVGLPLLLHATPVHPPDDVGGLPHLLGPLNARPGMVRPARRRYACRTVNGRSAFVRGRPASATGGGA